VTSPPAKLSILEGEGEGEGVTQPMAFIFIKDELIGIDE
jgi:hypothetical protein